MSLHAAAVPGPPSPAPPPHHTPAPSPAPPPHHTPWRRSQHQRLLCVCVCVCVLAKVIDDFITEFSSAWYRPQRHTLTVDLKVDEARSQNQAVAVNHSIWSSPLLIEQLLRVHNPPLPHPHITCDKHTPTQHSPTFEPCHRGTPTLFRCVL